MATKQDLTGLRDETASKLDAVNVGAEIVHETQPARRGTLYMFPSPARLTKISATTPL